MAKLIYRDSEFPALELVADGDEELTPEQATAWALYRLGNAVESVAASIYNLANEMPV